MASLIKQSQSVATSKSDKETIEKLTQEYLTVSKYNDRDLSEEEIEHEKLAEQLHIVKYRRIHPRRATIGFMIRGMKGGTEQAVEFLRASLPPSAVAGKASRLQLMIAEFDQLDEHSRLRVDCLDHLARKHGIIIMQLIAYIKDGILAFYNEMTSTVIAERKPELATKIFEFAAKEKHVADRRLAAEMSGLTSQAAQVVIDQSTKIDKSTTINSPVLSFSDFVKKNDDEVRGKKLIGEGESYVDAEFEEVKE